MPLSLTDAFVGAAPAGFTGFMTGSDMEARLRSLMESGQQAWPRLAVSAAAFAAYLGGRAPAEPGSAVTWLAQVHGDDLFLACACALRCSGGAEALEQHILGRLVLPARLSSSPAFVDEVRQAVRSRLLVTETAAGLPRIADYEGRGPLAAWVRVVALRVALNLQKPRLAQGVGGGDDAATFVLAAGTDVELDYLKARYREHFRAAFAAALRALPRERRNLLRLYYAEGLTTEQMAAVLRTSRPTVSRALAATREEVFQATQQRLEAQHILRAGEFASLAALLRSQIDGNISAWLRDSQQAQDGS